MLNPTLIARVASFIGEEEKPLRAEWIMDPMVDIYLRRSRRFILVEKRAWEALDLASIDVHYEHRNKGVFGAVVDHLIEVCPYPLLFAENPRPFLVPGLERRGFKLDRKSGSLVGRSLYRLIDRSNSAAP